MKISAQHMAPLAKESQPNGMSPEESQKLRKACADFEALLTQQMMSTMRETSDETEGLFKKSYGEKLFQSLADQEIAAQMAGGRGTGLGEMLFQQLSKIANK